MIQLQSDMKKSKRARSDIKFTAASTKCSLTIGSLVRVLSYGSCLMCFMEGRQLPDYTHSLRSAVLIWINSTVHRVGYFLLSLWLRGCAEEIFLVYTVPGTLHYSLASPGSVVIWGLFWIPWCLHLGPYPNAILPPLPSSLYLLRSNICYSAS